MSILRPWKSLTRRDSRPSAGVRARAGFTLIELLVVVAIIAMLMSILLPSLRAAREAARSAACGQRLRDFSNGFHTYFTENRDWIPGMNTSGVSIQAVSGIPGAFYKSRMPVQSDDWLTPIMSQSTELQSLRAKRFKELMDQFRCPSQRFSKSVFWLGGLNQCPDKADFEAEPNGWSSISYLMPGTFQRWGTRYDASTGSKVVLARHHANNSYEITAKTHFAWSSAYHETYKSMLTQVGNPARKICVADGTRYLRSDLLDFDPSPAPQFYGSFSTSGAWWCGSTAYGAERGSLNWSNRTVSASAGDDPPGEGHNLALSYRHGPPAKGVNARSNKGTMNAMFFDGSVRKLDDKHSRNPVYWYPRGSIVTPNGAAEAMIDDLQAGDRVP